jgi:ATP-dependent Clp protease ATP-binding subunit ClpX
MRSLDEELFEGGAASSARSPKINRRKMVDIPKPQEIKAFLDQHIIGQLQEPRKILSVAVYNHYKRISHNAELS